MILSSAEDLQVVGEVGDGSQAGKAAREHRPDVVLMDIRMPEMDGISATQRLRELPEPPQVIVLTTFLLNEIRAARVASRSEWFSAERHPAHGRHRGGSRRVQC